MKTHRVLLAAALGFCALGYPPTPLSTPLPSPPRPKLATRAAPLSAAAAARPPYRTDRVLVRPAPGADLDSLVGFGLGLIRARIERGGSCPDNGVLAPVRTYEAPVDRRLEEAGFSSLETVTLLMKEAVVRVAEPALVPAVR